MTTKEILLICRHYSSSFPSRVYYHDTVVGFAMQKCMIFDFFKHQQQQKKSPMSDLMNYLEPFQIYEKKFCRVHRSFIDCVSVMKFNEWTLYDYEEAWRYNISFEQYMRCNQFKLGALFQWTKTLTKLTPRKRDLKCVQDVYITRSMCASNEYVCK